MEEILIDADNKTITSCPQCHNQSYLYIISANKVKSGMITQWCESCAKPYVVHLETKLTAHIAYWKCEEIKPKKKSRVTQ